MPAIVIEPRPMREMSSPPKEMCFISGSKLVVAVVPPIEYPADRSGKSLTKGVLAGHLRDEERPVR